VTKPIKKIQNKLNKLEVEEKKIEKKLDNMKNRKKKKNGKTKKNKPNNWLNNPYARSLLVPEDPKAAIQIPSSFGKPTIAMHRHVTTTITTNSSGNMAFCIQPIALIDSSGTGDSRKCPMLVSGMVNNATTPQTGVFNDNSSADTYCYQYVDYAITTGSILAYRLTSAAITVRPYSNLLNNSGVIRLSQYQHTAITPTANSTAPGVISMAISSSNSNNQPYNATANINAGEYGRLIWLPSCPDDFEFIPVNTTPVQGVDQVTWFVGVIKGTTTNGSPAAVPFVVDLYLNYEVLPINVSSLSGLERIHLGKEYPVSNTVTNIRRNTNYIVQSLKV
jgi:hypothetical protein